MSVAIPSATLEREVKRLQAEPSIAFRNGNRSIQSGFTIVATAQRVAGALISNRYRIQRLLGRGGVGCTYLAADEEQEGRLCVLKEFNPQMFQVEGQEAARDFFVQEAEVLRQLSHPQIPQFLAWLVEEGCLFLVQEYIEGKNYRTLLDERQRRGKRFSPVEVVKWLRDLLPVLDYIHCLGIVHGDLSPDNIMLPIASVGSKPAIVDFGVVRQAIAPEARVSTASQAAAFAGKVGYSPPEQIRGEPCDPRSDLYSLAATALVLLTGKSPSELFDSTREQWQWQHETMASDRLAKILAKMLAPNPQTRYPSATAVLQALSAARDESSETQIFTTARIVPPPRYNYRRIAIASIVISLALGTLLATRAPYIPALCRPLNICLREQQLRQRYEQILRQGAIAGRWNEPAQGIENLQNERDRLATAIVQLAAIPATAPQHAAAKQLIDQYRDRRQRLHRRLVLENRAVRQLAQLDAIAEQLSQQTQTAITLAQRQHSLNTWKMLLKQLEEIPVNTFVAPQLEQRRREYLDNIKQLQSELTEH